MTTLSRRSGKGIIAIAAALLASFAQADIRQMDKTLDGDGRVSLHERDRASNFDRLQVRLFSDKTFYIRTERGAVVGIRGNWRNAGNDRVSLDVDKVGDNKLNGTGYITLNRWGTFNRVSITARDRSTDLSLEFTSNEGRPGLERRDDRRGQGYDSIDIEKMRNKNANPSFVIAHNGKGTFTMNGRRYRIDMVHVSVDKDGSYEVRFYGDRDDFIAGRYRKEGDHLRLDISRGLSLRNASGGGTIDLTKFSQDWWRVGFAGRVGKDDFSFEFRS